MNGSMFFIFTPDLNIINTAYFSTMAAVGTTNKTGIPAALFVEDVDKFMSEGAWGSTAELALKHCDELYQKYRFMEMNLLQKSGR